MIEHAIVQQAIPAWARWAALVWLFVWLPVYCYYWGPTTFLFLCDIAVILACVGIFTQNALLISSQAVSSIVVDTAWTIDIISTLVFRKHLLGGTEYFFDTRYPLAVRLISTFHIALPVVLLLSLRRTGYDSRAFWFQSSIAAVMLVASRILSLHKNINFALEDPFFRRSWGPAPVHLLVILAPLILGIYLPTHLALMRAFRPVKSSGT